MKYDRLIFFGDSFTAGDELADYIFIGKSVEETNKIKESCPIAVFYGANKLNKEEVLQKNKELVWGKKLADKLGVKYLNCAMGGTGVFEHYWNILKIRNEFTEKDIVIVGVTRPNRVLFFCKESLRPKTLMMGNFNNVSGSLEGKLSGFYDYYNDWNLNIKILLKYVNIIHTLRSLNVKFYIAQLWEPKYLTRIVEEIRKRESTAPEVIEVVEYCLNEIELHTLKCDSLISIACADGYHEGQRHGYGHCLEKHHDLYADRVAEFFNEEGLKFV